MQLAERDPWEPNEFASLAPTPSPGDEASARGPEEVIAEESLAIHELLVQARRVAATDATVLVPGETGTGKELIASYVHAHSERPREEMVRVNCAAIPSTLIESELFGREKDAYTDAFRRQVGRFELADQSTIFLDEIGDLPAEAQVKLLRVLQERQIERLGSVQSIRINTRIIAATHRSLEQRITEGTFRADLFYRLDVFPLRVPPLRQRRQDIPLRNAVERAMILVSGPHLRIPVPTPLSLARVPSQRLVDVQKDHIRKVLETSGWRVRGIGGAADRLGLRPTTLETRMAKLGLSRPRAFPSAAR